MHSDIFTYLRTLCGYVCVCNVLVRGAVRYHADTQGTARWRMGPYFYLFIITYRHTLINIQYTAIQKFKKETEMV